MPKYRIEYGSTYAGGESGEVVIDAPSVDAAWDVAMSRAASLCCFYSAEPADDEAKLKDLTDQAEDTIRTMIRDVGGIKGVDGASAFNNALHEFCLKYAKENRE